MNCDDFNIHFTKGTVEFVEFVLDKFVDKLPYKRPDYRFTPRGKKNHTPIIDWAYKIGYHNYTSISEWRRKGAIHPRAMNLLHKDLCILRQLDGTIPTIQELFVEFKQLNAQTDNGIS